MPSCDYEFIYVCKWFQNKRHRTPSDTMYYKEAKDTHYIFDTCSFTDGLVRVEYIRVCKNSGAYSSAVFNSSTPEEKNKIIEERRKIKIKNEIVQELHNHLSHC